MKKTSTTASIKPTTKILKKTLPISTSTKQEKSFYPLFCYDCNSNWPACADPVNLNAIKYNKKPCRNGSCYSVTFNGGY